MDPEAVMSVCLQSTSECEALVLISSGASARLAGADPGIDNMSAGVLLGGLGASPQKF